MTKHRLLYQASSGEYATPHCPISLSPLVQHHTDGTTSRDIVLLLPILESADQASESSSCLQFTHLPSGNLAFCNAKAERQCTCCGASVCEQHNSRGFLRFQDETGCWHDAHNALLCETCAHLSKQMRAALHTFRRLINEYEGEAQP